MESGAGVSESIVVEDQGLGVGGGAISDSAMTVFLVVSVVAYPEEIITIIHRVFSEKSLAEKFVSQSPERDGWYYRIHYDILEFMVDSPAFD